MDFKLDNLRALLAIREHGTFSKAADSLHISQSALTKRIQTLEGQINHRVIDRNTRNATLTLVGERLVLMAKQLEKIVSEMSNSIDVKSEEGLSGAIRIAASSSHLRPILLPRLSSFVQKHPNVHLSVIHGSIDEVESMLLDLRADLILTDRKINSAKPIKYYNLGFENFVVIRPSSDTNHDKFLGTVPSDPTFQQFMEKQKKQLRPKDSEQTFLGDVYSLIDAVSLGFGSAIVPDHLVDKKSERYFVDKRFSTVSHPYFLAHIDQSVMSKLEKKIIADICQTQS